MPRIPARNEHHIIGCLLCACVRVWTCAQFFVTTHPAPWCDFRNVVFGEVRQGMDVVRRIQSFASDDILYRPSADILVARCGTL